MLTVADRFWAKVRKTRTCWLWTGATNGGYGVLRIDGRMVRAHIWLWEQEHGPVPEGLELDHKCRRHACVRPRHCEPVTHAENVRRGSKAQQTHCKRQHPLSGDNIYASRLPRARICKTCHRERQRRYEQRAA